ncbi:hypothetical protein WMY93_027742 [Mugilogobius chulae]|uniref:Xeroderma pigmentosum, complementation group C n=1 Tax=Mugilogobius chulae TaxID=88201 RepID=A0AAW0MTW7_9GOBI
MAKKKESEAACEKAPKKKLQQPLKARTKKEIAQSAASAGKTDAESTSKYFKSPVKKEDDSDEDDFMEVPQIILPWLKQKLEEPLGPVEPSVPTLSVPESVEIEIETPEARKKKKRQAEWDAYLRRMVNRYKKDLLIDTHKVHLLCLVANARFRNSLCSEPDLLAITLSLLPAHFGNVAKERIDQNYLSGLHKWFKATFTLNPSLSSEECHSARSLLERRLASLSLFLLVLRSLQLFCRLVLSLQPVSYKPPSTAKSIVRREKGERGKKAKKTEVKSEDEEDDDDDVIEEEKRSKPGQKPKNSKRRSVASKVSYKEESDSDGGTDGSEEEFKAVSEDDSEEEEEEEQKKNKNATQPLTYVISVDGDGFLKDLGSKYDPTWMTTSRKRRVDDEWWEESLEPFLGPDDERDQQEDKELQSKLRSKPLPLSVTEYKNHPLYALKRHLLKYEAIYPETATVLGYCRGEPVYSRCDCVHTLHSRDTWLKEARTVRLGEQPYKMVKGFSNRSRKARMMSENKDENDLALFGEWQTEDYQPPIAVDGSGLCSHKLANLNRVARKLNLDAAPAVTGFDFHGGYSHAVTDGYIVCEEHEEILRAAWVEEQELYKQKEKEKREKKALSNWTLLVKGLLIRERLKQRYGNKAGAATSKVGPEEEAGGFSSDEDEGQDDLNTKEKTASETLAMSWPQNRQTDEETGKKKPKRGKKGEQHLFPFEKGEAGCDVPHKSRCNRVTSRFQPRGLSKNRSLLTFLRQLKRPWVLPRTGPVHQSQVNSTPHPSQGLTPPLVPPDPPARSRSGPCLHPHPRARVSERRRHSGSQPRRDTAGWLHVLLLLSFFLSSCGSQFQYKPVQLILRAVTLDFCTC